MTNPSKPDTQASDCTPIPVAAAKSIADEYAKSMVAILGYDPGDGRVYCATYGASAIGKDLAAAMGEIAVAAVGGVLDFNQIFEDFRATPAAESKAEIERLTNERDALAKRNVQLREALEALTTRMEEIHENEEYRAVWYRNQLNYGRYTGPKYEKQLADANAALRAAKEAK